jgi:hypothetical protein
VTSAMSVVLLLSKGNHNSLMIECVRSRPLIVLLACAALLQPDALLAVPIAVRHTEGSVHGFLVQLVFRFKDGSVHDDPPCFLSAVASDF